MACYVFFVTHSYSFEILRPLQRAARRRGDDVAWFTHGVDPAYLKADETRLSTVAEVQARRPDAVFVPGNWVPDFFPGAKVEVFHGLVTGKKGGSPLQSRHYRIRQLFDLYCTYSAETTAEFERLAAQHRTFHVTETGWPKLDPLFTDGEAMDLRRQLGGERPIVLYASTFSTAHTSAPALADTIERLAAGGRWRWLVTLHPKMDPQVIARYRSMEGPHLTYFDSGEGIARLLKAADVMLSDTSSIALEFILQEKPLVTFRTDDPGPHLIDVTLPERVAPAIERALERPEELGRAARAYADRLHGYRDGRSSERVLDAAADFIDNHAGGLARKPLNLWRRLKIRSRMRHYHVR